MNNREDIRAYWDEKSVEYRQSCNCGVTLEVLIDYMKHDPPDEQATEYMNRLIKQMNNEGE